MSERQKIKKILVPLDGSKNSIRGLKTGVHLAKEHEASLTVVHVVHASHKKELKQKKLEEDIPPEFILYAKNLAVKNAVPFFSRILAGDPGYSIVEYSNTHNIDVIVIGARGLSALKKIFLGSVSSYVMHKSKMAVMLIK
ncbi:UspA domain-containing protein [Nitrosotalea devaniterrae]|uniref:UspA domain-containing protein n=1 Tax=Nitrosotalea devaniterrae TaxID=1078905 RepID=A0A128A3B6_9ARCH|nr:UspA domain-containing protein [Candidatus Nitrosotalea devanaterra]